LFWHLITLVILWGTVNQDIYIVLIIILFQHHTHKPKSCLWWWHFFVNVSYSFVVGDLHKLKCVIFSLRSETLGINFAEILCIPKSSVKVAWHEPVDIPVSYATSWTAIHWFPWITSFTWAINVSVPEVEGWPDLSSSVEVFQLWKRLYHL